MNKALKSIDFILRAFTPQQEDIEQYRKELVLNVILALCFILSILLLGLLIASKTLSTQGLSVLVFISFITPFIASYFASRMGHIRIASWICIATFSFGTWYAVHTWSFTLPAALLSLVLTTTITGILISSRAGFIYAACATIFISIDHYIMQIHGTGPNLSWQSITISWTDMVELSIFLLFASGLTWLSNRHTELSLQRARNSELLLMIERNQLEIRVEERTKALEQARVEQISEVFNFIEFGKLSAGLIHDIMSPLNAICLELEQHKHESQAYGRLLNTINHLTGASQKIQRIINASRKQIKVSVVKEQCSLKHLVDDICILHTHNIIKYGIQVRNMIEPSLTLYTYPNLLGHVITNLMSNSIDACIEKLNIIDTASYIPTITISTIMPEQELEIMVVDNGIGIPTPNADTVFEPFFSTKQNNGCGYGLAASKHIIEKYFKGQILCKNYESDNDIGGSIGRSSTQTGTVFTIRIPQQTME